MFITGTGILKKKSRSQSDRKNRQHRIKKKKKNLHIFFAKSYRFQIIYPMKDIKIVVKRNCSEAV